MSKCPGPEASCPEGGTWQAWVLAGTRQKLPIIPVQVLTAQQLPKLNAEKPNSIVDPLVRVEIHGVPADCAQKETNYVLNNGGWTLLVDMGGSNREHGVGQGAAALDCRACALGFNPCWGQTLQFQLRAPELVLVRFVVEDYDTTSPNDFVGQFTLPLHSLKQGRRGLVGMERCWGPSLQDPLHLGHEFPLRACPEPGLSWSPAPRGGLCSQGLPL